LSYSISRCRDVVFRKQKDVGHSDGNGS
jgi:hypothetical protein